MLFIFYRRNLDYQDVLASLQQKGISIRVASPKLVMEEVGWNNILHLETELTGKKLIVEGYRQHEHEQQ